MLLGAKGSGFLWGPLVIFVKPWKNRRKCPKKPQHGNLMEVLINRRCQIEDEVSWETLDNMFE